VTSKESNARACALTYCFKFKYGRGYHPAALNLADCLAKSRNEPLLFKGDDFAKTEVVAAWRP
jgi:uncharacterized protein with PIN domain